MPHLTNKDTDSAEFISLPKPKFVIVSDKDRDSYVDDKHSIARRQTSAQFTLKEQRNNAFVYMIIPPDGGYGWIIVCFSFLNQLIVDGIVLGSANVFPYMSSDIMQPLYLTGLVMGIQVGFYFLFGVVASAFVNKYGFRWVGTLGIICAIIVLGIASFCSSLVMIIIFYSVLGGPSLSLVWVSNQLIVGYYFEKYRPIAAGIASSGAGMGISTINLLNSFLLPRINWRNTVRVHICLLIIAYFLLMGYIGIKPTRIGRIQDEASLWSDTDSTDSEIDATIETYSIVSMIKYEKTFIEIKSDMNVTLNTRDAKTFNRTTTMLGRCCPFFNKSRCCKRLFKGSDNAEQIVVIEPDILERQDAFYIGPLQDETVTTSFRRTANPSRTSVRIALETQEDKIRAINNRMQHMHTDTRTDTLGPTRQLIRAFILLFDWHLMTIKEFRILWFSALFFPMGLNVPLAYATAQAQLSYQYALFVTPSIGLSNFIVRFASGLIVFRYRQYTTIICGSGIVIGGLFVFLNGLCGSGIIWFQFLFCFCWGIAPAVFATLRALVYAKFLGLDKLTNAIGLTALAMGSGTFIGITISCLMFMYTGALSCSYMFAGICVMISGTLKLSLLCLKPSK